MSYVLYIIDEYPSTTQTFVVREIESLLARGVDVKAAPLRHTRERVDAPRWCLRLSTTPRDWRERLRVGVAALGSIFENPSVLWRLLLVSRGVPVQVARQIYAAGMAKRIAGRMRNINRQCVHVHAHFAARCADVARYLTLGRAGVSYSVTVHAADVYATRNVRALADVVTHAAFVRGISRDVLEHLLQIEGVKIRRTHIVHCGLPEVWLTDEERQGQSVPRGASTVRLVTVARLVEKKGIDTALRAVSQLRDVGLHASLTVVGDGPLRRQLEDLALDLDIASQCRFLGARDEVGVGEILRESDVFVLPCRCAENGDRDGIPVALMEAMALGIPVVTCPVGGIEELVLEGRRVSW